MKLDRYEVVSDFRHNLHMFLSLGPKGIIKKAVTFVEIQSEIYNLAFGDWEGFGQPLRDDIRSNNADRNKVLATVAHAVVDFMKYNPGATLYAEGSTKARTRLYQMGLNYHWNEISQLFEIKGRIDGNWESFTRNKNYDAFILVSKKRL